MFSKLSLTKKVMLLVAVPLALELSFIGVLANALNQVEHERRAAAHARDLATQLNIFLRMSMEALVGSVLYYFSRDDGIYKRSESMSKLLREQMEKISAIAADHPEEKAVIDRMVSLAHEAEHHVQDARDDMRNGQRDKAMEDWGKVKTTFKGLNEETEQIMEQQLQIEKVRSDKVELYEKNIFIVLGVGVGLNLFVAVLLVLAFNRSLVNRLIVISDNTLRLSAGKQLRPPVGGDDEISRVDTFFRQMAEALIAAREKEKEIEQLKRDFVAMVSHDLRTPLSSIRIFHSSLQEGVYGAMTERGKEGLSLIESEVERLINMVNELLSMEKLESGKLELSPEPVNLPEFLKHSADAVTQLAKEKGVKLEVRAVESPAGFSADNERLLQVMINLLGNAIKFASSGTSIEIAAGVKGRDVEFTVGDRNRTIPEEMRSSIFDRFKQVDKSDSKNNKGTGLGLAICKAIVERHGGTIGVRARQGGGNVFWFTIPVSLEAAQLDDSQSTLRATAKTE